MSFNAIHHVAVIGSDYEKSRHFYVDLLGFEVIRPPRGGWKKLTLPRPHPPAARK